MNNPFTEMTTERLLKYKASYEDNLDKERKDYKAPVNPKTNKQIQFEKMPWMVPTWTNALDFVNAELHNRGL